MFTVKRVGIGGVVVVILVSILIAMDQSIPMESGMVIMAILGTLFVIALAIAILTQTKGNKK